MEEPSWISMLADLTNEQNAAFEEYCSHGDGFNCELFTCQECLKRFLEQQKTEGGNT